jgi:hypothetical protein
VRVRGEGSVAVIPLSDRVDLLQGNVDGCVAVVHVVVWKWREALARQTLRVGAPQGHVKIGDTLAGVGASWLYVDQRLCCW